MPLHHIVLFRLHNDADVGTAIRVLDSSRPAEGVISWTVTPSLSTGKGVVVVEDVVFVDFAAFEAFRSSPSHVAAGEHMRQVADWLVGDYTE